MISQAEMSRLIGRIYDCAVLPELWPEALEAVREVCDAAYVMTSFADMSPLDRGEAPVFLFQYTKWDAEWFRPRPDLLMAIPSFGAFLSGDIDVGWSQLQHMDESELHETRFYKEWVKPQGLRDCAMAMFLKREKLIGNLAIATDAGQPLIGDELRAFIADLTPHVRRAMLIGDMVDQGRMALALHRRVLDELAAGILLLDHEGRVVYTNGAAEDLLAEGAVLKLAQGRLTTPNRDCAKALEAAVASAVSGDGAIGLRGIGIPLIAPTGARRVCHLLPLQHSDPRRVMGQGHAALFIGSGLRQDPLDIEILRTMFDLSAAEARVATMVIAGEKPADIAAALNVSVHTVRSQLSQVFAKTGTTDQLSLSTFLRDLLPPIVGQKRSNRAT